MKIKVKMTAQQIQPILKDIKMPKGEAVSDNRLTLAEYVEREESSTIKHEFHNGKIVEMAGGTPPHAQIALNFGTFLNICLFKKNDPFIAYGSDAEIYIPELDKSLYADVSAVAESPILFAHYKTLITNPLLIVEVLSEGTQDYDRHRKFEFYQKIPSFKEYVLVHQDEPKVETYYCKNGKRTIWQYTFATGLSESIKLQSVGCTLRLKDIYRNIEF
jgi:Uma2 family endonuclease